MCEITVVIPNYNGKKYLIPCIQCLYDNTSVEIQIIVVDNASTDGSIEKSREMFPEVNYIILDQNYGFCRAVNVGIQKSTTPYVILLNNDTEVKKGFVESLLKAVKRSDIVFSVEAKMIQYQNQSLIDSAGTFYNALGWAYARGKDANVKKYQRQSRVFAACAGAAIYRRSVFDKIGLFDETHFAYLEDVDVGYRAQIKGYMNMFEPEAEVIHVGSATSGSRYNEFKTRYSARNNVLLIYKNMPWIQILLNAPFLLFGFLVKAVFFFKKGFGKTYLCGLKEGIHVCKKVQKVPFEIKNLDNYCKIQLELWENIVRKFIG